MLQLIINGLEASLPPGFSTDYISSNRLFTDADDFSMSIELPLDGANRRIFGAIDRDDVAHGRCVLDADLIDGHVHKPGAITVSTITEKTAKTQFLAGRSYQNFYPQFDDVKLNSLELGSWPDYSPSDITPTEALEGDVIALPWMSESDGVLQNSITNLGEWDPELDALSWQIRLFTLTERICTAVGYTLYADALKNNREHFDLFCFNVVPADWNVRQWAALLPAWSLNEFFSFIELTLFAEIDVDHRARTVHFTYNRTILASLQTRHLEDIVDSHSVTISTKDESGYLLQKNRAYETGSNTLWNFMSCDWFFDTHPTTEVRRYPTLTALCADADSLTAWSTHSPSRVFKGLLYAEDVRTWFCVAKVAAVPLTAAGADEPIYAPLYELRPLNRFGNNIQTDDEDNTESTKIIPVALGYAFTGSTTDDFALRGRVALIDCGSQPDDANKASASGAYSPEVTQVLLSPAGEIEAGQQDVPELFDRVLIGYWHAQPPRGWLPYPHRDRLETFSTFQWTGQAAGEADYVRSVWSYSPFNDSLRLTDGIAFDHIDTHTKYEFKFLCDEIHDPRSRFIIHGKKYLCREIKCTLTIDGVSHMKTGIFYRIR